MRSDRIPACLALALGLAACSPDERPRNAVPETPADAAEARSDVAAGENVPVERRGVELDAEIEPDPQVGVELPEPPARVPENPGAR